MKRQLINYRKYSLVFDPFSVLYCMDKSCVTCLLTQLTTIKIVVLFYCGIKHMFGITFCWLGNS